MTKKIRTFDPETGLQEATDDLFSAGTGLDLSLSNVFSVDNTELDSTLMPFSKSGMTSTTIYDAIVEAGQSGGVTYWTANGNDIYNTNSGNIGIGISAPSRKLHINADASEESPLEVASSSIVRTRIIIDANGANADAQLSLQNNGTTEWSIGFDNSDDDKFKIAHNVDLQTDTFLTIKEDGNIGIGTSNPSTQLHIYNATQAKLLLSSPLEYNSMIDFIESAQSSPAFGVANCHGFRFLYNGSSNKFIVSSGLGATVIEKLSIDRDTETVSIGDWTTDTDPKLSFAGLSANGNLTFDVSDNEFDFTDTITVPNIKGQTAGTSMAMKMTALMHAEDGNAFRIPYYMNDLAWNTIKGGSVSVTSDTVVSGGSASIFDAQANGYATSSPTNTITIEIDFWKTFSYASYIGFSANTYFRAKDVIISVWSVTAGDWVVVETLTDYTYGQWMGYYNADSSGITKMKLEFSNFNQTIWRLGEVFLINYASYMGTEYFTTRGDARLYSDISFEYVDSPAIIFNNTTSGDTDFWIGVVSDSEGDDDDKFQIGDGATKGTNPFITIDTLGHVGINETSPDADAMLHITQLSGDYGIKYQAIGRDTAVIGYNASSQFIIDTQTGGYRQVVLNPSGGFVGIGITVPTVELDLVGDFKVSGSTYGIEAVDINFSESTFSATNVHDAIVEASQGTIQKSQISLSLNGNGSPITTGEKTVVRIPYNCTVTGWDMVVDVSTSTVVDIWVDSYANFPPDNTDSITNGNEPTITTAIKAQSSDLSGWSTTSLYEGNYIKFNIDSNNNATELLLTLHVEKS